MYFTCARILHQRADKVRQALMSFHFAQNQHKLKPMYPAQEHIQKRADHLSFTTKSPTDTKSFQTALSMPVLIQQHENIYFTIYRIEKHQSGK